MVHNLGPDLNSLHFRTVADVRRKLAKVGKQIQTARFSDSRADNTREMFAVWRADLNRVLCVFNVRLVVSVQQQLTPPSRPSWQ